MGGNGRLVGLGGGGALAGHEHVLGIPPPGVWLTLIGVGGDPVDLGWGGIGVGGARGLAGRSAELGWESRVGVPAWSFPVGGVGVLIGFPRRGGPVGWSGRCCKAFSWWGAGVMVGRSGVTGAGAALVALPSPEGGMDMLRGKSRVISPRSVQVARLRYSLLAMGEKYTICLVSTPVDWILMRSSAAPKMGRLVPEAERI